MREGAPSLKQRATVEGNEILGELRNNFAGQGAFFEKLAADRGLPIEMQKLPESLKPRRIETAKGSVYSYLEDGRTQRFKKATNEMCEPQDLIVFVPPWKYIGEKISQTYADRSLGIENEAIFIETLLEYAQKSDKTIRIVDEAGKELLTNEDVQHSKQPFMALINKAEEGKPFYVPVGKRPAMGWLTFDIRKYTDADGTLMREKHLGNAVAKVEY